MHEARHRKREDPMLFGRCAWHRRYHGYPSVSGVVSWRGLRLRFTDGICRTCLDRFRAEHRLFLERRRRLTPSEAA